MSRQEVHEDAVLLSELRQTLEVRKGIKMAFMVKSGNTFELLPEGSHPCVLADIADLGERPTKFGIKPQVRFVWLSNLSGSNGYRLGTISQYNVNLHPDSYLSAAIRVLTGSYPASEFDLESLIGLNAVLVIEHTSSNGRDFAAIRTLLRPGKNAEKVTIPPGYKRRNGMVANHHGLFITDDDLGLPQQ
jgi:hypothetical protein